MSDQRRLTEYCKEIIQKADSTDWSKLDQEEEFQKTLDKFIRDIDNPGVIESYSLENEITLLRRYKASIIVNWKERYDARLGGLNEKAMAAGMTILMNFFGAIALVRLVLGRAEYIEGGKRPLTISWPNSVLSNYYDIIWALREIDESMRSMEKDFAEADPDRILMKISSRIVAQRLKLLAVSKIIENLSKLENARYPELAQEICRLNTQFRDLIELYKQQVPEVQKAESVLGKYGELFPNIKQFYLDTIKRCVT